MSSYFGKDKLSKEKQIRCNYYTQISRNIVRMTDFSHSDVSVFVGNKNIIELFNSFPNTDHDLLSFCIDTTMFNVMFKIFEFNIRLINFMSPVRFCLLSYSWPIYGPWFVS